MSFAFLFHTEDLRTPARASLRDSLTLGGYPRSLPARALAGGFAVPAAPTLRASLYGASPRYYGLVRLPASLSRTRLRALRVRLAPKVPFELRSSVHSREVSRVPLLNFPDTRSPYAPPRFHRPSRFDGILSASQRLNCWPRGTLVTRLYVRGSLALSLIRSSGETRAHRSPFARTTLAPPSERPDGRWISAFLTVRRLLYSNDSFHSFSSAEFRSAYRTLCTPFEGG